MVPRFLYMTGMQASVGLGRYCTTVLSAGSPPSFLPARPACRIDSFMVSCLSAIRQIPGW